MVAFRRLAALTALATFVLIVVGGIVRVSGSGLGCPDWPTCHGQIVPPLMLQALVETSHRWTAAIVSILVVATAVVAIARRRDRAWLTAVAILAVLVLIVQIALGAFTVELELTPLLVTAHLGTALALFATTTVIGAGARWSQDQDRRFQIDGYGALALLAVAVTYLVLLVGSFVSESSAAYACVGWPLCDGNLGLPTDGASSLNLVHRLLAVVAGVGYLLLLARCREARPGEKSLRGQLYAGLLLLIAQVAVGAGLVIWRIPPFTAALHLALAAAFWGNLVAIAVLACLPRAANSDANRDVVTATANAPIEGSGEPATLGQTIRAYVNLTKPWIILLLLITTLGGMIIAERGIPPLGLIVATLIGGACAAGGANAINCYIDRDIDQLMRRTRKRSLPAGRVSPRNALIYGLVLGVIAFVVLYLFANLLAAVLAEAGLLFYVLIYTGYLKRSTPQNIVIGGAAGAMPPMVGWVAVTGQLDLMALYLFAIIFFWTPPHFWALSLLTSEDYARANIPMLPLVVGEGETRRQILLYSILLVAVTVLVFSGRGAGYIYLLSALALGAGLIFYAARLLRDGSAIRARQLFKFSNYYLALLFLALAVDRVVF
jgi:protoheme IX farnesyltransferase